MKNFLLLSMLLIMGSCGPGLPLQLIQDASKSLAPLSLQPTYELTEYRLDLIRQQVSSCDSDGNTQYENVAYHQVASAQLLEASRRMSAR